MNIARVLSVNVGQARPIAAKSGMSGIDKRPVAGAVSVRAPGPKDSGPHGAVGSGLAGDAVCDRENHGGEDQAVYAYAREDLDVWQALLDRPLVSGSFGENLTTVGIDVTAALVGERWRIGEHLVLEVTSPRLPCRTFAVWLGRQGWVKTFTERALPGAYLRVVEPGMVQAGDQIEVVDKPSHSVTIGSMFRALIAR
ncbi:MAG: MOSC domain-containing protein [Acidimicrobiales bacterium]